MKPIITVYSTGTTEQTKKFEGYISAAFWIGVDHVEGDVNSVKVRQPVESYDAEVATLTEFADLMVQRQISFSVEFFTEPAQRQPPAEIIEEATVPEPLSLEGGEADFEDELAKIKEQYKRGLVTRKQYDARKGALLRSWKEKVEGKLER